MKQKLLITGTCGFIFGQLVRNVIQEKHPYDVCSLDKMVFNEINSYYNNKSHKFHIADITDQHILDIIFQFEKPDVVIHGAASTHVDTSLIDPNSFIKSNVLGTQNIINSCLKHGVKKLVYQSTDEVYGQLTSESDVSWTEDSPYNPRTPYAASKAAGELLVKAACESHGLTYNIVRSCNNYGPRQNPEKLIPKAIKSITEGKSIPIYGEGAQIRDWMHVNDNCNAILKILQHGKSNETYNVGANQEISNIEVIQKICNIMEKGHNLITHIPDPRGNGHDFRYSINCSKIKELGWSPTIKFKDGIINTIDWYLLNNWFFK